MRKTYFTVGPTHIYPLVPKLVSKALREDILSLSHRSEAFQELYSSSVKNIKKLLNIPKEYSVFFLSSGTEAMEVGIQNLVHKKSFHLVNGSFSNRFYNTSVDLKKNAKKTDAKLGKGFSFERVKIPKGTELTCITQNETSSGVFLPPNELVMFRKSGPDSLFALDIVSSAPYVKIDFTNFDYVFFSVQKGFCLPAGMGIAVLSPRAREKAKFLRMKNVNVGSHHSFENLSRMAEKNQTVETPNVLGFYLLKNVTDAFVSKGISQIREETDLKAQLIYDFLIKNNNVSPFVKEKKWQSPTVIVGEVQNSQFTIDTLKKQGFIIGKGYGDFKNKHIRIANFPSHSVNSIKKLLLELRNSEHNTHLDRNHD